MNSDNMAIKPKIPFVHIVYCMLNVEFCCMQLGIYYFY